jgi:hypothetical protein
MQRQTGSNEPVRIDASSRKTAEALHRAKESEVAGIELISRLLDKLG